MKKLNNIVAAFVLMAILVFGTTAANAGILVDDATGSETCTTTNEKPDWGVVITNIVGVVITNLGGILIPELKTSTPTNCGVVITN